MQTAQTLDDWLRESPENRRMFHRDAFILGITEELCAQMEQKGINRAQLATRLGKSKAFISQVLNGHRNMTVGTLADVAFALDIPVKVHFGEVAQASRDVAWETAGLFKHNVSRPYPHARTRATSQAMRSYYDLPTEAVAHNARVTA